MQGGGGMRMPRSASACSWQQAINVMSTIFICESFHLHLHSKLSLFEVQMEESSWDLLIVIFQQLHKAVKFVNHCKSQLLTMDCLIKAFFEVQQDWALNYYYLKTPICAAAAKIHTYLNLFFFCKCSYIETYRSLQIRP